MNDPAPRAEGESRWAPLWLYLLVILGANAIRQVLLPVGTVPVWAVAVLVVVMSSVLFVVVTAAYRTTIRR